MSVVLVLCGAFSSCKPGECSLSKKCLFMMAVELPKSVIHGSMDIGDLSGDNCGGVGHEGELESSEGLIGLESPFCGCGDTGGDGARIFLRLALGEKASMILSFIDGDFTGLFKECVGDTGPSLLCEPLNVLMRPGSCVGSGGI